MVQSFLWFENDEASGFVFDDHGRVSGMVAELESKSERPTLCGP